MDQDVIDEIEAVRAIWPELNWDGRVLEMAVQNGARLWIEFRDATPYPAAAPVVTISGCGRGEAEPIVKRANDLAESLRGSPMLFDIVSLIREALDSSASACDGCLDPEAKDSDSESELIYEPEQWKEEESAHSAYSAKSQRDNRTLNIVSGPPFTDRKSTFQAHVAHIQSREDAEAVVSTLLSNGKIARATHNISAWRIRDAASGASMADNDDDGEDAAGGRLAELLSLMSAENLIVVVSRWYGGIQLGPARFKHINNVARQLIEAQPWYKGRHSAGTGSGSAAGGGS